MCPDGLYPATIEKLYKGEMMIVRLQNLAWGVSGLDFNIYRSFHMFKEGQIGYRRAIKLKNRAIRALYSGDLSRIDAIIDKFKPSKVFNNGSLYTYKEIKSLDVENTSLSSKRILDILIKNCFPAQERADLNEIQDAVPDLSDLTVLEMLLVPYADVVTSSFL